MIAEKGHDLLEAGAIFVIERIEPVGVDVEDANQLSIRRENRHNDL